jgi:hypothetical protein
MGQKPERKWNLYAASFFVAVMVALMGFGAALTTQSHTQPDPVAERVSPAYEPSVARLTTGGVAQAEDSADRDGAVYMYY